jgi:hypothetical protein
MSANLPVAAPFFRRVPPPDTRPEYPLPEQGQLELWLRSYAPFKDFGGGYAGDNRLESTDPRDTAKVTYILTFDYAKMAVVNTGGVLPQEQRQRRLSPDHGVQRPACENQPRRDR